MRNLILLGLARSYQLFWFDMTVESSSLSSRLRILKIKKRDWTGPFSFACLFGYPISMERRWCIILALLVSYMPLKLIGLIDRLDGNTMMMENILSLQRSSRNILLSSHESICYSENDAKSADSIHLTTTTKSINYNKVESK